MTRADAGDRATTFLDLHRVGAGFLLPNAWDAGSARLLAQVGFPALATTSAGISFAHGLPDGAMTRSAMLSAVAAIVAAVDCPVSADLEAGYGAAAEDVAATVAEAVALGLAGANIEDRDPATGAAFEVSEATERIAAARSAAPEGRFVLNARVDAYLLAHESTPPSALFDDAVDRADHFVRAGADCIFVPGVDDPAAIAALVEAVDAPLNVVAGLTGGAPDAAALRALGVARISIGGSLARAALGLVERAGRDLLERDDFGYLSGAIPHHDLQRRLTPPG